MNAPESNTLQLHKIAEFYRTGLLYSKLTLSWGENMQRAVELFNSLRVPQFTIDSFCPQCGESSTFSRAESLIPSVSTPSREPHAFLVTMRCARTAAHHRHYAFYCSWNEITKVAEYPSAYETSAGQINSYRKILTSDQMKDLKNALAGASHGIGAGALIYLRRLFESLVEGAHQQAKTEQSWNEQQYATSRMAERIQMLARWLPQYLVENRKIYSIMSAGIHNLSEEDCLAIFPIIRVGIVLILEQHLAARRNSDLQKDVSDQLQQLQDKIASGKLTAEDE